MGFKNFIRTLGQGVMGVLGLMIPALPGLIQSAEAIFGPGRGSDKLQYVQSLVYHGFGVAEMIAQKDIVDEDGFAEGMKQVNDGIVRMLNASLWHKRN
jgi:hypothetical protein